MVRPELLAPVGHGLVRDSGRIFLEMGLKGLAPEMVGGAPAAKPDV